MAILALPLTTSLLLASSSLPSSFALRWNMIWSRGGQTLMESTTTLKLAKSYVGNDFLTGFNFFTANDPTGGYVNYLSQSQAQSASLIAIAENNTFIMRADAENQASGRGRNSVRIGSNDQWADGVYILDLNHMPTGCGTWPAFWTVVENGWPSGGEIDIIEGANSLPTRDSVAWNATLPATTNTSGLPLTQNTASLHTADTCNLQTSAYQSGTFGSTVCAAGQTGNIGCGVEFGGKGVYGVDSFGAGVNQAGGGWYAMWRDVKNTGGVYVYFWPRTATDVPDDVRYSNTTSTNVANWGQPAANLTVPSCKGDFGNHVIVFNIAFCGDYAASTYTASGCPSTCTSFVMNNPTAFAETYWSINSLRVYTESGKPAPSSSLSGGAIAGIVVGSVVGVALLVFIYWRWKRSRKIRLEAMEAFDREREYHDGPFADPLSEGDGGPKDFAALASAGGGGSGSGSSPGSGTATPTGNAPTVKYQTDKNGRILAVKAPGIKSFFSRDQSNRLGKTVLAPGKSKHHFLRGETPLQAFAGNQNYNRYHKKDSDFARQHEAEFGREELHNVQDDEWDAERNSAVRLGPTSFVGHGPSWVQVAKDAELGRRGSGWGDAPSRKASVALSPNSAGSNSGSRRPSWVVDPVQSARKGSWVG